MKPWREAAHVEIPVAKWAREHGIPTCKLAVRGDIAWPDRIFFIHGGLPIIAEFKVPGKMPRAAQAARILALREKGYDVQIFHSAADAVDYIRRAVTAACGKDPRYRIPVRAHVPTQPQKRNNVLKARKNAKTGHVDALDAARRADKGHAIRPGTSHVHLGRRARDGENHDRAGRVQGAGEQGIRAQNADHRAAKGGAAGVAEGKRKMGGFPALQGGGAAWKGSR